MISNTFKIRAAASSLTRSTAAPMVSKAHLSVRRLQAPCRVSAVPTASSSSFTSLPMRDVSTGGTSSIGAVPVLGPTKMRRRFVGRRTVIMRASHFPFEEQHYHRVQFLGEPYGPLKIYQDPRGNSNFTGVMVFKRTADPALTDETKIMEVFVAGDTAVNIFTLINNQKLERPMVHDVIFSIMQQAQSEDSRRWGLLRVAIVDLQNDVFVGRLFFGDPLTGKEHWDCDCRPSDGCFLSIKCNAPLYIIGSVWDAAAKLIQDSTVHQMLLESRKVEQGSPSSSEQEVLQQEQQQPLSLGLTQKQQKPHLHPSLASASGDTKQSINDYLKLMEDDLDVIKLLKRKLAVALHEENYKEATRLRDHPYMMKYKELFTNRLLGQEEHAARAELELRQQIEGNTLKQEPRF